MKLLGKDLNPEKVLRYVGERLKARGLAAPGDAAWPPEAVEARIDPLAFTLDALTEHADPTRALPLETHRDGLSGRLVVAAKRAFRAAGQVFINEALGRQRVFNGHVRDGWAQLAAEVQRLQARVQELEAAGAAPPAEPVAPPARQARAKAKAVRPPRSRRGTS